MRTGFWYMLVVISVLRVMFVLGKCPQLRLVTPHEHGGDVRISAEGFAVLVG